MLGSRGVDLSLAEDIVQDVALRALDKRVPFTDPDDLYRWAATTARNLHIDHVRSGGRTTGDDSLVGVADDTDVAHAAERRVALAQVWRALAVMRPREREAILDSLHDREARSSQVLVRRHRARATLRKAVGGVLVWTIGARLRLRELVPSAQQAAATAVLAPVLVAGAFVAEPVTTSPPRPAPVAVAPAPSTQDRPRVATHTPARRGARPPVVRAAAPVATTVRRDAPAPDATPKQGPTRFGPAIIEEEPEPPTGALLCVERAPGDPIHCVAHPDRPDPSL